MELEQILNIAAALLLIVFGLYAIVQPRGAAKLGHLSADDGNGLLEMRMSLGWFSVGMGAAPLILNQPVAFQVPGLVLLAAFFVRLGLALLVDKPTFDRGLISVLIFDLTVGLILIL